MYYKKSRELRTSLHPVVRCNVSYEASTGGLEWVPIILGLVVLPAVIAFSTINSNRNHRDIGLHQHQELRESTSQIFTPMNYSIPSKPIKYDRFCGQDYK